MVIGNANEMSAFGLCVVTVFLRLLQLQGSRPECLPRYVVIIHCIQSTRSLRGLGIYQQSPINISFNYLH